MLLYYKNLNISHRKHCYAPSDVILKASLMYNECLPCGIFEVISHPQDIYAIYLANFVASVGLG